MTTLFPYMKKGLQLFTVLLLSHSTIAQSLSDSVIKENRAPINNPLQQIALLEPISFEYNQQQFRKLELPAGRQYGLLAENVQSVFPEVISVSNIRYRTGKNSFHTARVKNIEMEKLIPVLIASIKELQTEIDMLKKTIRELNNK